MSSVNVKTYYGILGVGHDATQGEIKRAYRKQLKRFHPDRNKSPNALERTKEIIEAWEVLGDK